MQKRVLSLSTIVYLFLMCLGFGNEEEMLGSLKDQPWTEKYEWVRDFRYDRIMTGAPESTPHRRRTLGGAERSHYPAYTMRMKSDHVRSLADSPWVTSTASADDTLVLGRSSGWDGTPIIPRQPVYGYKVTDPDSEKEKISVVLAGGNHGREHPACWALHAMVDFLVSADPRAEALRRKAVFYVYPAVNPDGKFLMWSREDAYHHADGNPELASQGLRNHNRIWHTEGRSTSADIVKAAMKRDTGGNVDYLIDFHGVPHTSFLFAGEDFSPYSAILVELEPGLNLRSANYEEGWLRSWATSRHGLNAKHAYTAEVANPYKEYLFIRGRNFALGFYELLSSGGKKASRSMTAVEEPSVPNAFWLFDGNTRSASTGAVDRSDQDVEWSKATRFSYPENKSVKLREGNEPIDLGQPSGLDTLNELTVALWVRGESSPVSGEGNIIARRSPDGNERSWWLAQDAATGELVLTVSSDGSYRWDRIKRIRTTAWPREEIFDGSWRHLAFTFDGSVRDIVAEPDRSTTPERVGGMGAARFYLDGIELKKGAGSHVFANGSVEALHLPNASIFLGAEPNANSFFAGAIDELAIWTTSLSAEEIGWLARHSLRELTQ